MKKIWLGIGAVVIIILLLLQTKFNIYLQLEKGGYAIVDDSVKQLLLSDPENEVETTSVPYYSFDPLDYIYQRGNSYYMGENKKTEIDIVFPLLINGGAGIQFIEDSGTLYDVNFEEVKSYPGLMINNRISYNPGGERADADEYLFCALNNGFFINLDSFEYDDDGELRDVAVNSSIYFKEGYFTYCELEEGMAKYQISRNMADNDLVYLDGKEYTYHDLLLLLHVISQNSRNKQDAEVPSESIPFELPENEMNDEASSLEEERETDIDSEEEEQPENEVEDIQPTTRLPQQRHSNPTGSRPNSAVGRAQSGNSKKGQSATPLGVRPDSMRPDKLNGETIKEPAVVNYQKPTVTITNTSKGVYRLMIDLDVDDPADRLNKLKKVQLEYYEQMPGGGEKLVYRSYASGGANNITAGSGVIKPETEYRVNVFYTYWDEYNNSIVETVDSNIGLTTDSITSLGNVVLKTGLQGDTEYQSIPIYYDNQLVLCNVAYDEALSDPEAVYGITSSGGLTIDIQKVGDIFQSVSKVDGIAVNNFKKGFSTDMKSMNTLKPTSKYTYEIIAKDYFDNTIQIENNTGEFETCKSRPIAKMDIKTNKIGDFTMDIKVDDPDESAIATEADSSKYDFYYVISTKRLSEYTEEASMWDACQAYITNGNSRVVATETTQEGTVHFLYRFKDAEGTTPAEYLDNNNKVKIDKQIKTGNLDLNTKYYAYLFADFNLNNKLGDRRFESIVEMPFTSAALSSLGDIYINVEIPYIGARKAELSFELNTERTNDTLEKLLSKVQFDIQRTNGEEPIIDYTGQISEANMRTFTGWYTDELGERVEDPSVSHIATMETVDTEGNGTLKSMTDYEIVPTIQALYNGQYHDMNVRLTKSKFKTMREPATVQLDNVLFAAGTLYFDVSVKDVDQAITGNSGHVVVMNLYDYSRNFIKAIRIPKNTETPVHEEITGLDPSKRYIMNFIAIEYNEGYTNSTFKSNEVIYTYEVNDSLNILGSIKLQEIVSSGSNYLAKTQIRITDVNHVLKTSQLVYPYFVDVEMDGTNVNDLYDSSLITVSDYSYGLDSESALIKNCAAHPDSMDYRVEKGSHTYKLTLYIYINNNKLVLDTLTFQSDNTIESISNAQEFVEKIKTNQGEGKYCVTADIQLGDHDTIYTVNGTDYTVAGIVGTFNGEIDFQGYSLEFNKKTTTGKSMGAFFGNIGPKGEIYNAVFKFKGETSTRYHDTGFLCRMNYGHIHDVIVKYQGGSATTNQYVGLLCRINSVTGLIERFVVSNEPEEGLLPFAARYSAGLVAANNEGIVRDGYAYGSDIYSATGDTSVGGDIYVGGILGGQSSKGQTLNVYSLVNVSVADPDSNASKKENTRYGSVIGSAAGKVRGVYGIGQSFYSKAYNGSMFNKESIGPVLGVKDNKAKDVYYWNEDNYKYPNGAYQNLIGLESLYDYTWQGNLLGSQFDVQPVEVGFYPHVILSEELPEQPFIELPGRRSNNIIDVMSTKVISYEEDGNSALVEFRLSNNRNTLINQINIKNLKTVVVPNSDKSLDGYTTLQVIVSNPEEYVSSYEVESISYSLNGRTQLQTFNPKPVLFVDFYRSVSTAEEWYDYVVCKPKENVRIENSIDFTGIPANKIRVMYSHDGIYDYEGKLDGGFDKGYRLTGIDFSKEYYACLFYKIAGEVKNLCVENIILSSNSATSNQGYNGLVALLAGDLNNVHVRNIEITGKNYIGGLASYAYAGSTIQDSSISNIQIMYKEPANTNTNAYIGGLVGYGADMRLDNCFVRNLNMIAEDLKNCEGAGGIIGLSSSCALNSLYATGSITVRGMNVGGIIGRHTAAETTNSLRDLIAKVNIKSYQDNVGGLIGETYLSGTLNERNNMSGVAFGNVFCSNTDAENVSYTTGSLSGVNGKFYGSDFQLYNGMLNYTFSDGKKYDKNTYGLISYEQAKDPATYTASNYLNMDNTYNFSKVTEGYLPTLYYMDSHIELPFQTEDILITSISTNEITVGNVGINTNEKYIWLTVYGPAGYKVTGVTIDKLKILRVEPATIQENGTTNVRIFYDPAPDATFITQAFLDSYELTHLYYTTTTEQDGFSDFTLNPVRIPLTLYRDIYSIENWDTAMSKDRNYGNYENYRICADLAFGATEFARNTKIGRLQGYKSGGKAVLSGINLTKDNENLIFRLNSELSNVVFKDCTVSSGGRDCVGLIGTSAAIIYNVDFENIKIDTLKASRNYVGIIGYQVGGGVGKYDSTKPDENKITMKKISVGTANGYCNQYVGGLVGYAKNNPLFCNIEANEVEVRGNSRVGGIAGGTAKASFDHVTAGDFIVTGLGNGSSGRIGGIIGVYDPGYISNNNSAFLTNITLSGTPSYEGERITASSTVISVEDNSKASKDAVYVGGITGYSSVYAYGFTGTSVSNKAPNYVNGIIVKGYGNDTGGISGYSNTVHNSTIENSLITQIKPPTDFQANYYGGIAGYNNNGCSYNLVKNVQLRVYNCNDVGLIMGRQNSAGISYNSTEESAIYANNTQSGKTTSNYGGICGYSAPSIAYCTVVNTTIDIDTTNNSQIENVGGIVGYSNNNVDRCFYFAQPETDTQPTAQSKYFIEGTNVTGGIIGRQYSGGLYRSYSNANVISQNEYAGGLSGEYRNNYTSAMINGKNTNAYSYVYMQYNYFAGTVEAKDKAGGAIGRLGMTYYSNVSPENRDNGGRNKDANASGGKSGADNERVYTRDNLILASKVNSIEGDNAYAFCGNLDGFEGKPNRYDAGQDASGQDKAYHTFFWEAMQLNTKRLNELTIDSAPDMAKPLGAPNELRFKKWKKGKINYTTFDDYINRDLVNARTVSTADLKTHEMYYALRWYRYNYAQDANKNDKLTADFYLLPISDTVATGTNSYATYTYKANYQGKDSLPLIRISTGKNTPNDWLTNYQGLKNIRLPIPDWSEYTGYRMMRLAAPGFDTYGMIYSVDADKLNVEFSDGLIDSGYFMLYYGDQLVDMQLITKRAYSYQYDFRKELKLYYGYADIAAFQYDMEQQGYIQGEDYRLEDLFGSPDYLFNLTEEPIIYSPAGLEHHIMTYRNKYYYLSSDGIVSGTGSGVLKQQDDTMAGKYITLYDGKALTEDRRVIDVENGNELRVVDEGILPLDETLPLQSYTLNGYTIETYAKFTDVIGEDDIVSRNTQMVKSMNHDFGMIDGSIQNVKDAVVLYTKEEKSHCTVLDEEGHVVDLYQADDIGAPQDFKNSGIVYMTNNFKCSAPFILVEYANGGIVGYNYMTGEYLFDNSIQNEMGLLDYAKVYFTGDKSELLSISNSYAANSKLAKIAATPERLLKIVAGNNLGNIVEDNSTGNGIKAEEDSLTGKGTEPGIAAKDNTAPNTESEMGQKEAETVSDTDISDASSTPDTSDTSNPSNISDTPGTMGVATESDSGNKEEMPVPSVTAAVASTATGISGEGLGTGNQLANGLDASEVADGNTALLDDDTDINEDMKVDLSKEDDLISSESKTDLSENAPAKKKDSDILGEEPKPLVSTAGTPVKSEESEKAKPSEDAEESGKTDGIINERDSYEDASNENGENESRQDVAETNEQLVTVYNMTTGTYEIIDLNQYLSSPTYQSENVKLAVRDLSVYAGYANKEEEKKKANGLGLYILVSIALLSGIGLTIRYRKKHKMKF